MTRPSAICIAALALVALTACNPATRAKEAKSEVDSGNAAACVQEKATIESAVQAYTMLVPDAPVTEAAMVTAGYIRAESQLMDVQPDGTVIPAPGTVCT